MATAADYFGENTGRSVWALLDLSDEQLSLVDVLELNLAVARGIPAFAGERSDVAKYSRVVDGWADQFRQRLPEMEVVFRRTPHKWGNDLKFFRLGMLAAFLGHEVGVRYVEFQRHATNVRYTDPGHLFLNGLIDTRQGTCASMPVLLLALSRRMGWPNVWLSCVRSHLVCRYDDGETSFNIEMTDTAPGSFAAGSDIDYVRRFELPEKAVDCGSDLRPLSARETIALFISFRARHFDDAGDDNRGERDYLLARALFPTHRATYLRAMPTVLRMGARLFESDETGHPRSMVELIRQSFAS